MYEHRYFVVISAFAHFNLGSTGKRLAAATTTPVFNEDFAGTAGLSAGRPSRRRANRRRGLRRVRF
jgi:hypothetical protein